MGSEKHITGRIFKKFFASAFILISVCVYTGCASAPAHTATGKIHLEEMGKTMKKVDRYFRARSNTSGHWNKTLVQEELLGDKEIITYIYHWKSKRGLTMGWHYRYQFTFVNKKVLYYERIALQ